MLLAGQDYDAPSGCENRGRLSGRPGFDGGGARAHAWEEHNNVSIR
jgi:hypothetical protein